MVVKEVEYILPSAINKNRLTVVSIFILKQKQKRVLDRREYNEFLV